MVSAASISNSTSTDARNAQRETILVVEDDPEVRAFTVETVRELGYDVFTKPFAFHDLATRIRSVLDGQDSPRHAT